MCPGERLKKRPCNMQPDLLPGFPSLLVCCGEVNASVSDADEFGRWRRPRRPHQGDDVEKFQEHGVPMMRAAAGLTPRPASPRLSLMNWRDRITTDPLILKGKPCIKDTRIPAALVLGYLAAGRDTPAILKEFPDLTAEDVAACLDFARDLASSEATAA